MIYTQRYVEQSGPFRIEKYRLTTELEASRQKMVVDPDSIKLSLPYARDREAFFLDLLKDNTVSYLEYNTCRITSSTDYQILPGPESPDAPVMNCKVYSTSGQVIERTE